MFGPARDLARLIPRQAAPKATSGRRFLHLPDRDHPSGATAIVAGPYGYSVCLIDTKADRACPPIGVGASPVTVTVTG